MRRLPVLLLPVLVLQLTALQPVRARHAMVVAQEYAAEVGVAVLEKGGNAVDAAVAVGFALAVTYPYAGNLGGGGFMLVRFADGRSTFIDFRERAPEKASRDMYLDAQGNPNQDSVDGWRAAGVPGSVRGFELAQSKYGSQKWDALIAPAIELATKGYILSYKSAELLRNARNLAEDPESKRIFQKGGSYYDAGDVFVQPELAATLRRIAASGAREFYEGETARRLVSEMATHGGLLTFADLQSYRAVERTPLTGAYRGLSIL